MIVIRRSMNISVSQTMITGSCFIAAFDCWLLRVSFDIFAPLKVDFYLKFLFRGLSIKSKGGVVKSFTPGIFLKKDSLTAVF